MRARSVLPWLVAGLLLLPAVVLTLARLLGPEGARGVQLVAFTPWGLPAYGVAAAVLATVAWRRRSSLARGLAALAVAGLVVHGWWFSPMLVGGSAAAEGEETLTVMSANMFFGDADGEALVRNAAAADVDLLVVQEVTEGLLATMEEAGVDEVFPHRAGAAGPSAQGTMVFATVPLGEAVPVDTSWGSWLVEVDGLSLLAVHPFSPVDVDRWWADHRLLGRTVLAETPDLVVGDFNATLDHAPMRELADAGWRSTTELANEGWLPTWSMSGLLGDAGLPLPPVVQIDHVLLAPPLSALATRTVALPGSDHRALVAEIALD